MVGDERRVVRLDDGQLVLEPLRVGEAEEALAALSSDALLPEVERVGRGDAPDDAVHHAGAGAARSCVRILEERDVGAGAALLVGVEEVVDGRVVLVHRLLHEPQAERARVVLDVPRRVAGDARDVMHALELHRAYRTVRDRAHRAATLATGAVLVAFGSAWRREELTRGSVEVPLRERPGLLPAGRPDLPPLEVVRRDVDAHEEPRYSGLVGRVVVRRPLQLERLGRPSLRLQVTDTNRPLVHTAREERDRR